MVDNSKEIKYTTMFRAVPALSQWAEDMGYSKNGLALSRDYHVRYYKSFYKGVACYYVCHSAIEYIFTKL